MTAWVGVDPGLTTGIAVLIADTRGVRYFDHRIVDGHPAPGQATVGARVDLAAAAAVVVCTVIGDLIAMVHNAIPCGIDVRVAVEAVNAPTGFAGGRKAPIDPAGLIPAAVILGAVLATWPDAVLGPPGGNGHGALRSYPAELVTAREKAGGLDRPAGQSNEIRHARSAWDIAVTGPFAGRRSA